MSTVFVSNSTTYILSLPQGKPNTKIPLQNGPTDDRPRIAQSPQKGPNCTFYAMNMLRRRIGKNPGSDHVEARRIEKLCSDFYKKRTELMHDFEVFIPKLLAGLVKKGWSVDSKSSIEELFPLIYGYVSKQEELGEKYRRVLTFFEEFVEQTECSDIYAYLEKKCFDSKTANFLLFLSNMGVSPREQYEACNVAEIRRMLIVRCKNSLPEELEWKTSVLLVAYPRWEEVIKTSNTALHHFSFFAASKAFGFKISNWDPTQPIEKLQEALKVEGALMVSGLFGDALYSKEPSVVQTIAGRPIFGWKPSDRREFDSSLRELNGHCIVVIGAAQGGKKEGFVYFVDPKDGSDLQHPLQQRIYVVSKKNFSENIVRLQGSPTLGYAQYYPHTPTS
jgi:hypothetical protein